jgi:hypothetical protein
MLANFKLVFKNNSQNHCGAAQPVFSLGSGAQVTQPNSMITHGSYMYLAPRTARSTATSRPTSPAPRW